MLSLQLVIGEYFQYLCFAEKYAFYVTMWNMCKEYMHKFFSKLNSIFVNTNRRLLKFQMRYAFINTHKRSVHFQKM